MKTVILVLAASLVATFTPAYAGPCSQEIAMVTKLLGGGGSASSVAGAAAPSIGGAATGALGTGTPSAADAAGAMSPAAGNAEALQNVQLAQKADQAGDETSCMDYISKAKQLLGLVQ